MSGLGQAMHPILNYVEFRTNPEPYMVQGVVHGYGALNYVEFRAAMHPTWCMAEGVGFEPTSPFREAVFKTAALNHSAIPPCYTSSRSSELLVRCSK
jgi:hypothetical protein